MNTTARFFSDPAPEGGTDARRFTVDCKHSTTCLWWIPGEQELSERQVISNLLERHERECGRCRLDRLWKEHGDPALEAASDRMWAEVQCQAAADLVAERQN